jgi:putative ABC transport system ATP-binding protein
MSLEVRALHKGYNLPGQARLPVLTDCSFTVARGSSLAITGPSGSGKSTLLALLAGLDRPDSGQILLQDEDLTRMSEAALTRFRSQHIGIIFQQFHLMPHLSAEENVRLPLEIHRRTSVEERARAMLAQVGLESRANHLPGQLSGGECQRVAIARALVVEPSLLLADEPTGNLDEQTGNTVSDLLFALCSQLTMTLLVVTHNPALAARCQHQRHLEQGRLA